MSLVAPAEVAELVPDYSIAWKEIFQRFYGFALRERSENPGITLDRLQRASV